ncbi:MAG: nucleotide exchange factor GrpE [Planctomycetota bacterium]|nr:nucleotide exchange factor GrpE [Planctomycetota bacterium]
MHRSHHEKPEHARKASEGAQPDAAPQSAAQAGEAPAHPADQTAAPGARPLLSPVEELADETEACCADLERFFRRAVGDLPSAADVGEMRAQQATVRDLVERASKLGSENSESAAELTAEVGKLKDDAVRARADFLNYQARTAKDLVRAEELALRQSMSEMLPILDSVILAVRDAQPASSPDALRLKDALGLIYDSLCQTLAVRGLQRIVVQSGTPFDPNLHEAVALRPANPAKGEKPNTVLEELRAGYLWKGLLLRPVQVLVSEPDKQAKKDQPTKGNVVPPGT